MPGATANQPEKLSQVPYPSRKAAGGAPRKHGGRLPTDRHFPHSDAAKMFYLGKQKVRGAVWHKLHFKRLAQSRGFRGLCRVLEGRWYTRATSVPLWLFWTGLEEVAPQRTCAGLYLWRFAIEHLFRFLKQHLVSTAIAPFSNLESLKRWIWLVALATGNCYSCMITVQPNRPALASTTEDGQAKPLTPAQVQRSARYFCALWLTGT